MGNCLCFEREASYARYHANTKDIEDIEPDLDTVIGSILEIDPSLADREEGVAKINSWIEESAPDINMSPENLEISRWKCIKYWEAQHVTDVYGAEYSMQGSKLTGSCVRFYFEKRQNGEIPRLVIEHCGRSNELQFKDRMRHTWSLSCGAWYSRLPDGIFKVIRKRFRRSESTDDNLSVTGENLVDGVNTRMI
eukprot:gene5108-228_t